MFEDIYCTFIYIYIFLFKLIYIVGFSIKFYIRKKIRNFEKESKWEENKNYKMFCLKHNSSYLLLF
jgi:hypothetical protein